MAGNCNLHNYYCEIHPPIDGLMDWDRYGADFAGPVSTDEDNESVTVEVPEILTSAERRVLQDQLSPLE